MLFSQLPPVDLISYSKSCKLVHKSISSCFRRAFRWKKFLNDISISKKLINSERFNQGRVGADFCLVVTYSQLRFMTLLTGLIISGSTALEFFRRTEYEFSSLDLYVDHVLRRPIVSWLHSIGYVFLPRPEIGPQSYEDLIEGDVHPILDPWPCGLLIQFVKSDRVHQIRITTSFVSPPRSFYFIHVSNIVREKEATRKVFSHLVVPVTCCF
jgi:hypothetical protein